jgi:hypothetical protein
LDGIPASEEKDKWDGIPTGEKEEWNGFGSSAKETMVEKESYSVDEEFSESLHEIWKRYGRRFQTELPTIP